MMKESAKGTTEYEQYKQEFTVLWDFYNQKIEAWCKENCDPNFRGKDGSRPRHIEKERNIKLKELQKKYHMLFE